MRYSAQVPASPPLSLHRIAPPRFLAFGVVFVVVSVALMFLLDDRRLALLIAFDAAAVIFLASVVSVLDESPNQMRQRAAKNDANRAALLAVTVLLSIIILFAVGTLITSKQALHWQGLALIVGTLALTWVFANVVFALHYAHLYYLPGKEGDRGGLRIPHVEAPDYWDFVYFSFTLGMTFQTSDIAITGRHIRRVVLGHTAAAFLFNIGVLAFVVNALGAL